MKSVGLGLDGSLSELFQSNSGFESEHLHYPAAKILH
jgi:hypothetical protein